MLVYYTSDTRRNPLTAPITSRFAVHLAAVSESSGSASDDGHHNLNSPIYLDTGCRLFSSCLDCPLTACKDDLSPKELRREIQSLRNSSKQLPSNSARVATEAKENGLRVHPHPNDSPLSHGSTRLRPNAEAPCGFLNPSITHTGAM